jgi:hypothetical protein
MVKLQTRLDVEAMDITKGRTDMPAAVARLTQLVPPARVDLVDEVLVRVGRRDLDHTRDWPPVHLVHQLAFRVKRMHLGEMRMRGPDGVVVDVIRYRDKMKYERGSGSRPGSARPPRARGRLKRRPGDRGGCDQLTGTVY